jgi:hypothetical protein
VNQKRRHQSAFPPVWNKQGRSIGPDAADCRCEVVKIWSAIVSKKFRAIDNRESGVTVRVGMGVTPLPIAQICHRFGRREDIRLAVLALELLE